MKPLPLIAAAAIVAFVIFRWRKSGWEGKAIGIVIAAGLLVYGSGLVEFPDFEKLIEDAGSTLGNWTYLLVGALAFLETGAFLSFVAPGEFTIVLGGVIAGQGEINVIILIGVVWFCAVAGDCTSFFLGRRLGRGFLIRHGARVKITEERLVWVEKFYERHGGITVFIGRFVGLLRALGPFIAGASKMPFRTFLPYDILGGGLWGTTFVLLGFIFWRSFDQLKTIIGQGAFALGTTIAIVVGIVAAVRFFKVPENRVRTTKWLDEQERKRWARPFVRAGRRLYAGVLRPAYDRAMPTLRFVFDRVTPGGLGLELTTLFAIAAVGGFAYFGLGLLIADEPPHEIDLDALSTGDDLRSGTLVDIAQIVTVLGTFYVAGAFSFVSGIALIARRRLVEGIPLLAALPLLYAGVHIMKAATDRARPEGALVETEGSSFPSGHAAYAVVYLAVAVAILHAVPGIVRRTLLVTLATLLTAAVGLSRTYLRAHYLTDVLGGWGLGALVFALCGCVALIVGFVRHNERVPEQ